MFGCRVSQFWLLAAVVLCGQIACSSSADDSNNVTTDTGSENGTGGSTTTSVSTVEKLSGETCSCDSECEGTEANPGICFLGICMQKATAACIAPNTQDGCAEGFSCFNSDIVTDGGVCFPVYDAETCQGVENRFELCSPVRGESCDATCGVACTADDVTTGQTGAACSSDSQCDINDPTCYSDEGDAIPNGWVEGYCMAFGCEDQSDCGVESDCFPVASDGSGICMNTCGTDLDCRAGYTCRTLEGETRSMCFAGCDAAATCPEGYDCLGDICVSESIACSGDNPYGWCPDEQWCDEGTCSGEVFACEDESDPGEPNNDMDSATSLSEGTTEGLTICADDEDWYVIEVPAATIAKVGIEFQDAAGDLDFVVYDSVGNIVGSRYGDVYPYSYRSQETNTEYYGLYSQNGEAIYYLRAIGYKDAQNVYSLSTSYIDYVDGADCEAAGYSKHECHGGGEDGEGLIPFPFADPLDTYVGDAYISETYANYRFARRELVMMVRYALSETLKAFPDTTPLSLIDICQIDGITPGYDVGDPRHPETTHDQGGNIDISYFQTDGDNNAEIICGDGSEHADGWCSDEATTTHIVDLPRQAFFMAKLFDSSRTRVIGVDEVIAPLILAAAEELNQLEEGNPQKITNTELNRFDSKMAYGSGWPYHHHHIHLSLQWWTSSDMSESDDSQIFQIPGHETTLYQSVWPPRAINN